ncbi:MAG: hypothetical protein ACK4UU_06180, partial [Fimbriimonadales bacterium]
HEEPLKDLLTALLMQESPPMTPEWAQGCIQRLKEYALRRKRTQLAAEITHLHPHPEANTQNAEKLQEYWRIRVESIE